MRPEIMTVSGSYFNFEEPDPNSFTIEDIAYALSNTCRFGGHCSPYYSVAAHCVYVSYLVEPQYALEALLHDAAEAFVGDIPSPLKRMLGHHFKDIEHRVEDCIMKKFGVKQTAISKIEVKAADLIALRTEREELLPRGTEGDAWWWVVEDGIEVSDEPLIHHSKAIMEEVFLARFQELTEEKKCATA